MRVLGLAPVVLSIACFHPADAGDSGDASSGTTTATTGLTTTASSVTNSSSATTMTSASSASTDGDSTSTTDNTSVDGSTTGTIDCDPGMTPCSGVCVDTATDAANCGACGHDCVGGDCVDSACQAVPLGGGKGRLMMVLLDDEYVYYGGDGVDVGRVGKDGTNDTIIGPAGSMNQDREWCYDSDVADTAIVWVNDWVHQSVRGCETPDCPGGPSDLVTTTTTHYSLRYSADAQTLYYDQGMDLIAKPWPLGAPVTFATQTGSIFGIATDADFVYWTSRTSADPPQSAVRKRSHDGGGTIDLSTNRPVTSEIAVATGWIFWGEDDQLVSVPLPDGGDPTPVGSSGATVYKIRTDDTHVYWTGQSVASGFLARCPLDGCGGDPEILVTDDGIWGLALDDAAVYWVTEGGDIGKLAK